MKWDVDKLKQEQHTIAQNVSLQNALPRTLTRIAGADISFTRYAKIGYASIVVIDYETFETIESVSVKEPLPFPYIPTYLAFREWPLIESCIDQLSQNPDLLLCDGQGLAHPRKAGLACHIGVKTGWPTIGCAKSRLIGEYVEPALEKSSRSDLIYKGEKIGEVLRTRTNVKPLFISPGHKIDFATASDIVLSLCPRFRQPIPVQLAHKTVNEIRKSGF